MVFFNRLQNKKIKGKHQKGNDKGDQKLHSQMGKTDDESFIITSASVSKNVIHDRREIHSHTNCQWQKQYDNEILPV